MNHVGPEVARQAPDAKPLAGEHAGVEARQQIDRLDGRAGPREGGDLALGEDHPTAVLIARDHVQDPRPWGRHAPWGRLAGGALLRPGGLHAEASLGGGRERQTRAVAGAHTIDKGAQELALAREHELWV